MTGYFTLFLSLGIFSIGAFAACPDPEKINPCTCYANSKQIRCEGTKAINLNSTTLTNIGKEITDDWNYLYIHGTKLDKISAGTFKGSFANIFIHSNNDLKQIEDNAFGTSNPVILSIVNNPNLDHHDTLFKLIRSIGKNLKTVELNQNGISAIPNDAFHEIKTEGDRVFEHLAYIRLDEQKPKETLTVIGSNAFANLPSLTQLSLDNNAIRTIKANGIDLSLTKTPVGKRVSIFLGDNELTETELVPENIKYVSDPNWTLGLVLEKNKISQLKDGLINQVASNKGNTVFLTGNKVGASCDCNNVKEIVKLMKNPDFNNIKGIDTLTCSSDNIKKCPTFF